MLKGLYQLGFSKVVATPHIRPGLFDNCPQDLQMAYRQVVAELRSLPANDLKTEYSLASEHFFCPEVVENIVCGQGMPYIAGTNGQPPSTARRTILVEFDDIHPLASLLIQLEKLQNANYLPLIAHPERYRALWNRPELAEELLSFGCALLLDTAALSGKYGSQSEKTAWALLKQGVYAGACSDAHHPKDIQLVAQGMQCIENEFGISEAEFLFKEGPNALLLGQNPMS